MAAQHEARGLSARRLVLALVTAGSCFLAGLVSTHVLGGTAAPAVAPTTATATSAAALWTSIPPKDSSTWPTPVGSKREEDAAPKATIGTPYTVRDHKNFFRSGEGGRRRLSTGLDMSITSEYSRRSPAATQYPWLYLAEPYRVSSLQVSDPQSESSYRWSLPDRVVGYGESLDMVFTTTGYNEVLLERLEGDSVVDEAVFNVMVKYVRREIRSLSDADRELWLSAMSVMQRVPTVVGKEVFGDDYVSRDQLTRLHMYYGGAMGCDHWHQGAGFVTSHVALTLVWEKGLQAIEPSIAAPYWDFTLESTFFGSSDWHDSKIFSSDWFGEGSPDNELHTVTEGRWSFVPMMMNSEGYTKWHNAYGLMRAPWNLDSTPFVTRSMNIYGLENNLKPSGCEEYHRTLKKSNWMSLAKVLNSAAHGHIHETMGGAWNHPFEAVVADIEDPPLAVFQFAHWIQSSSKILWRAGVVKCSDSCDMSTPTSECNCACDEKAIAGRRSYEVLDEYGLLDSLTFFDSDLNTLDSSKFKDHKGSIREVIQGHTKEESKEIYDSMLDNLCTPGHLGDMFQASSPNDVTFWVIHSTIDRVWHFMRLGDTEYDQTWEATTPCYGHNPTDFQPFSNLFGDDHDNYYTNKELYDAMDPSNDALPYVYDNFEWPHCNFLGFEMTN